MMHTSRGKLLFSAALTAGLLSAVGVQAKIATNGGPAPISTPDSRTKLAQVRDADIYIDDQGREIIVDSATGQVIAVHPPSRVLNKREVLRQRRQREVRGRDRPPLSRKLREELEVRLGLREAPLGGLPSARSRGESRDAFPEAPPPPDEGPRLRTRENDEQPQFKARGNVEREPLGEAPISRQPDENRQEFRQRRNDEVETARQPDDSGSVVMLPEQDQPSGLEAEPEIAAPPPVTQRATKPDFAGGSNREVAKIQILLDRLGASPGVIDGRMGSNVDKALAAYQDITGGTLHTYDTEAIAAGLERTGGDAFMEYTITPEDVAQQYVASIPSDYGEKSKLGRLAYTSVAEMLAERFHLDENYLKALNPGVNFSRPGTVLTVVNPGAPASAKVAKIIADKGREQVRAYAADGSLIAAYPATIGSDDTPSPSGTVTVERVAFDPQYTYNPKINFKQEGNDGVLTIPPGPNGPVGSIWIALSKPTYGIHGTPEPDRIGKTNSHGCVRLTNWDAQELAKIVKPGVVVEFR